MKFTISIFKFQKMFSNTFLLTFVYLICLFCKILGGMENGAAFPGVLGNKSTCPFIVSEQGNKANFGEQGT